MNRHGGDAGKTDCVLGQAIKGPIQGPISSESCFQQFHVTANTANRQMVTYPKVKKLAPF